MTALLEEADKDTLHSWVRLAQQGDRRAFGRLFQAFERQVFALALRRLNSYAEAEELCQDVFIQAMEKLPQLREPACFGGWLRSITQRMAINRIVRRDPSRPSDPETLEHTCIDSATPLSRVLDRERAGQVRDGLDRLGALDRATLEAFYVRGQSLAEMSDEFSAPLGTIKRRLHVARKRLAEQVEPLAV